MKGIERRGRVTEERLAWGESQGKILDDTDGDMMEKIRRTYL